MKRLHGWIARVLCLSALVCMVSQASAQDRYVVTLELSQSHFTLDIWEHVKDAANKATFDVPVDKVFYDSVKPGQEIVDQFRTGSLVINGSFGSWVVKVKSKRVVR